jgi:hypothetical protein
MTAAGSVSRGGGHAAGPAAPPQPCSNARHYYVKQDGAWTCILCGDTP